ncbi:hypothetical protein ACFWP3_03100 [Streptomyces sp. NPDC058525]|uniref:hypothetical protein n=1 Tax=Streptomyces sp. NPDC058525 TaxID=3346538 RepID=UPI00365D21C7
MVEAEEATASTPTATTVSALIDLALHLGKIGKEFRSPPVFPTAFLNQLRDDPGQHSSA